MYGVPFSVIHPIDNKLPDQFVSDLNDPALNLTEQQKQEIQDRIDDLYMVLKGERDYVS
jgi:hypothetical protein